MEIPCKRTKKTFRKICQTKNLPDSDPDLTSSSLVTFGPKFDCILLDIQNFTWRRMRGFMICKADVCLQTIIIYISVFCKQQLYI
jgi:hypothetical protein